DEDRASYDDISSEDDMIAAEVDELQGIELYDISEDPWNFITSSFNPLQSELIPLECYESPALCKFEVEKKASDILDISDRPTEAESILDLIKQFADAPHHDKWVESMESLPTLFDNGLTYLIIKEDNTAVVEKIIEWTMEGVDLDKAMKQPESAFKVRHLKMGIKLTGALTSFSPDFAKKLILKDIQHKLINLFVSPYMAFSVKLLIVQALDKTVRFIDGLNWFLGTHTNQIPNKQTCYQRVLEIMMGKQLVRTTVALSCFLKKIHVFEVLKNFSRTVTNIVNSSSTNEDKINTKLTEIQDWLAPCQKQSYGYEGLSSMINLLKHTSEEIQKQPMPLVTVLRLLHNLAIPSDTRFPDENPKELKYKYALIELYSADCLPILMTILQ
ncbi:hypothetical protein LOTGIDRAFT_176425, partial [Lottia gigantea]